MAAKSKVRALMRMITPLKFRTLPFEEAARQWLEIKKMHSKEAANDRDV